MIWKHALIGAITIGMLSSQTLLQEAEKVYATDVVNIRRGASTETEIVGKLHPGESVDRIGSSEDWSMIKMEDETYYIHSDYLSTENPLEYLGEFKITAYCGGRCCNGKWAGQTSTGVRPSEGTTIAVAPWVIPYGTMVYIEGVGTRVAQDTGGFANRNDHQIDLYFDHHGSTDSWGVQYRKVWIVKE